MLILFYAYNVFFYTTFSFTKIIKCTLHFRTTEVEIGNYNISCADMEIMTAVDLIFKLNILSEYDIT